MGNALVMLVVVEEQIMRLHVTNVQRPAAEEVSRGTAQVLRRPASSVPALAGLKGASPYVAP
jgi:hypothetical protein